MDLYWRSILPSPVPVDHPRFGSGDVARFNRRYRQVQKTQVQKTQTQARPARVLHSRTGGF